MMQTGRVNCEENEAFYMKLLSSSTLRGLSSRSHRTKALRGGLARGIFGHGLTFERLSAGYKFRDLVLVVLFFPKPFNSLTRPLLEDFHQFTIYQARLHPRNEKIGLQEGHPIPILGGPPCFHSWRNLVFRVKNKGVGTPLVDAQPSGTLERPLAYRTVYHSRHHTRLTFGWNDRSCSGSSS